MDLTPELLLNGILALLIIKEVLNFVIIFTKSKSSSGDTTLVLSTLNRMEENQEKMLTSICDKCVVNSKQISDMHKWHDARDEDGVFLWYIRKSLSNAFDKIGNSIYSQNDILRQLLQDNKDILRENNELRNIVKENREIIEENRELIKQNTELMKRMLNK